MKKSMCFAIAAAVMGFCAASQATENCPVLKNIEEVGSGVYRAKGERGEWLGVMRGVVAQKAPVQTFEEAITIQEGVSAPLKFQHCSYGIGKRNTLEMRFIPTAAKEFAVNLEGNAWLKQDGPFGLIYHVCAKTSPDNCKFAVIQ